MKGAAIAAILASIIFILALLAFALYAARFSIEKGGARLVRPLSVGLHRDPYRAGYWAPIRVGGRNWHALVDTGSPYLVVPNSLPCAGGEATCDPTGQELTLTYGDGTKDSATFEISPFGIGGARFPGVIFGGNEKGGEGSPTADDVILGLSALPSGVGPPPPLVVQMRVQLMVFDFLREARAALVLSPSGSKDRDGGGPLVASGDLLPPGALRAAGYPLVADLYVVALDPARCAAEGLPPLKFLLLDTGTTLTLVPPPLASPPAGFTLHLADGGGSIPIRGSDAGTLPPDLGKERGVDLAVLGNRSMSGYRLAIDLGARRFTLRGHAEQQI